MVVGHGEQEWTGHRVQQIACSMLHLLAARFNGLDPTHSLERTGDSAERTTHPFNTSDRLIPSPLSTASHLPLCVTGWLVLDLRSARPFVRR